MADLILPPGEPALSLKDVESGQRTTHSLPKLPHNLSSLLSEADSTGDRWVGRVVHVYYALCSWAAVRACVGLESIRV